MKEGMNCVVIAGNLGADPEVRMFEGGGAVCNLRIAVGERYKDRQGHWQDKTEWVSVSIFGKRGEALSNYLHKGSEVLVRGRIRTRSYEKDGQKRYATEVVADEVILIGGRRDGAGAGAPTGNGASAPAGKSEDDPANWGGGGGFGGDDDIPF